MNVPLFELVVTYIETHIFVPSFSISHIFISVIKFFCCFLLLGKMFTLNLQNSKIYVVPGRGFCRGVILQGRQLKRRFSFEKAVMLEKKMGCNRRVFTCTQK